MIEQGLAFQDDFYGRGGQAGRSVFLFVEASFVSAAFLFAEAFLFPEAFLLPEAFVVRHQKLEGGCRRLPVAGGSTWPALYVLGGWGRIDFCDGTFFANFY